MTPAEAVAFAGAAQSVASALIDIAQGKTTTGDVETIADVTIQEALSFVPGVGVFAQFAPEIVNAIIIGFATGETTPGTSGEGQTSLGRGGRRD